MCLLGDRNHPKKWGYFDHFYLFLCKISPTTNINIFQSDRPCQCWFYFRSLFCKTHPSSSDLKES